MAKSQKKHTPCDEYFWIDFDNQLETLEDGREVYKIYFPFEPEPAEYWREYSF